MNRPEDRVCCYCSAVLDVELDRLLQDFLAGKKKPQELLRATEEDQELPILALDIVPIDEPTKEPADSLPLLDVSALVSLEKDDDFSELQSIYQKLIRTKERAQKKIWLHRLAQRALALKRNLGRDVELAWGNKVVAFVMEGLGDLEQAASLSEALSISMVRARALAAAAYPSFAIWAEKKTDLEDSLRRYSAMFGRRSVIVSKALLLRQPSVQSCLGLHGRSFLICDQALWLRPQEAVMEERLNFTPQLAVIGMVEEVFYRYTTKKVSGRLGQKKRERVRIRSREERRGVIDLHGEGVCIRIVEGVSDFSSLPGYDASSERRSFKQLCGLLSVWFSGLTIEPVRMTKMKKEPAEGDRGTAWPDWETYSRACRLLYEKD